MKKFYLVFIILLSSCQTNKNDAQDIFTSFLKYGSYEVGFKSFFPIDYTRPAIPFTDWDGGILSQNQELDGRSIPIHVWYPANDLGDQLDYGHFINLIAQKSNSKLDSLSRKVFVYQANELGGRGGFTLNKLNELRKLKTKSFLKASPINEKFPLVVFPNGTSPAYQSIMCEYLASHGFVVAALPLMGRYGHTIDVSVSGLETAVDDLHFGLQEILQMENVAKDQVALLANAIESSFAASFAARTDNINALISLDGGFLSSFEQEILARTSYNAPANLSIPILSIYSHHPLIDPSQLNYLKYSDRYFARFPNMSEFHFLNFGVFEEYFPGIIGDIKGDTKKGFEESCKLILAFLKSNLKDESSSFKKIYAGDTGNLKFETIDSLFYITGFQSPPTITDLKDMFKRKGMNSVDSVFYAHFSRGDEHPFEMAFYEDFKNWLAWNKDPDFKYRQQLFGMSVKSYPDRVLSNYLYARYSANMGDSILAQKHYKIAKQNLSGDRSLDLNLRDQIVARLNELISD